jgi:mannose-6-phosphate isomerase-like protein (cupin superfamily)
MTVIRESEAISFELPGVRFSVYASPSTGSAGLCTWRLTVDGSFASPTSHTLDSDEVFMVLSGEVSVTPDGPVLRAGDAAVVPAGDPISVVNHGPEPAQLHVAIRSGFKAKAEDGSTIPTPPWAQ